VGNWVPYGGCRHTKRARTKSEGLGVRNLRRNRIRILARRLTLGNRNKGTIRRETLKSARRVSTPKVKTRTSSPDVRFFMESLTESGSHFRHCAHLLSGPAAATYIKPRWWCFMFSHWHTENRHPYTRRCDDGYHYYVLPLLRTWIYLTFAGVPQSASFNSIRSLQAARKP